MAKTQEPGEIAVGGQAFETTAIPDPYDIRDLEYRSVLRPLPPQLPPAVWLDPDDPAFAVLTQAGQSCTGHAVASAINTVLTRHALDLGHEPPEPVSPYMLYRLARRYDNFAGEDDIGSSLRGAFKGWLRHGVALDREWAARAGEDPIGADIDLDDPDFVASCRRRPLGAYYRVNPYRLDDMQSAVSELHAIAATAAIHTGWASPVRLERPGGEATWVIGRAADPQPAGGHAFAIVGYNEVGFLIQNSWGREWGNGGFAILTYEDWLQSAYDAWVARPGVPNTPFAAPASASRRTSSGDIVLHGGPNLTLLRNYVVNTGIKGRLSTDGNFASTPRQIDGLFDNMAAKHAEWVSRDGSNVRHVVLYAHGGLIDEMNGLKIAENHLGFWLNNHVYPINFVWQSGAVETLLSALIDLTRIRLPLAGVSFDLEAQWDRMVEGLARQLFSGLWAEMKGNGVAASDRVSGEHRGGTIVADRLRAYVAEHGRNNVRIHLAGHSAGAVFLSALARRLLRTGLRVDSLAFMGGALRSDEVARDLLPHLASGRIRRFTTFNLSERDEQDDKCPGGRLTLYNKSLLYLVARGLEDQPDRRTGFVPLIGLERGLDLPLPDGRSLGRAIADAGGAVVTPPGSGTGLVSKARGHGDFDTDPVTMASVLLRMPDRPSIPLVPFGLPHAAGLPPAPNPGDQAVLQAVVEAEFAAVGIEAAPMSQSDAEALAAAGPPGEAPSHVPVESGIAPITDAPNLDVLVGAGWRIVEP